MKRSSQVKPFSYLKAHAEELLRNISEQGEPLVITQNGEVKAVTIDTNSNEQPHETMAFLKMLALGMVQIEKGKVQLANDSIQRLRVHSKSRE